MKNMSTYDAEKVTFIIDTILNIEKSVYKSKKCALHQREIETMGEPIILPEKSDCSTSEMSVVWKVLSYPLSFFSTNKENLDWIKTEKVQDLNEKRKPSMESNNLIEVPEQETKQVNVKLEDTGEESDKEDAMSNHLKRHNESNYDPVTSTPRKRGRSFNDFLPEMNKEDLDSSDVIYIETKFRQPYSRDEDQAIINYFLDNGGVTRQNGETIWKKMEECKIVPQRTWQSLKTRWHSTINKNLDLYGVTVESLMAAESSGTEKINKNESANLSSSFSRGYRSNVKYYTAEEDTKIVQYIIKNKGFKETTGNSLWKNMEESNMVPGRTWLSLKERFRKTILLNIEKFNISSTNIQAFQEIRKGKKKKRKQK